MQTLSCLSTSKIFQRLSPPGTSTSSIDITQERFLSQSWKQQDVHSLISVMKNTKVKDGQLRQYIEKLLSMKREEIADLSVSTSVSSSGSFPSHTNSVGSGFVSSTPASILTSSRYCLWSEGTPQKVFPTLDNGFHVYLPVKNT